jgi:2,3-bisphosphoglycerate-dependent phosphoglycerate mutase
LARLIAALMRHGHYRQPRGVPSARLPHPLTRKGETQARAGAALLWHAARKETWRIHPVIDSSNLLRAWQTATIVADAFGRQGIANAAAQSFDALDERGLGSAANLTMAEIAAAVAADPRLRPLPPAWKADSRFRLPFPGAESLMEAGERAAAHIAARLSELADLEKTDSLKVFVGHGGAFRHAAVHFGLLAEAEAQALSMHHCRPVFLERLGDGAWRHVGGAWKRRTATADALD